MLAFVFFNNLFNSWKDFISLLRDSALLYLMYLYIEYT